PEAKASGGQVIGSTATARRVRGAGSVSPVNTCHQRNALSAHTDNELSPSLVDSSTLLPPGGTSPNARSSTMFPIVLGAAKSYSPPATRAEPIGSRRASSSNRLRPGTASRTSSTGTPGRRRYGWMPKPNGQGWSDRFGAECSPRNPSGPMDQVV